MDAADGAGGGVSIPLSDAPLSDDPLLDLLDALVEQRGKMAASEALGVNYRTMMACYESRRVSRRMRRTLEEFRDRRVACGDEQNDEAGDIAEKVAALEEAHGDLVETVEAQAKRLAEVERKAGESGTRNNEILRPTPRRMTAVRERSGDRHDGGTGFPMLVW